MQQHYAAFDKASVADRVFGQIQNGSNRGGANGARMEPANVLFQGNYYWVPGTKQEDVKVALPP